MSMVAWLSRQRCDGFIQNGVVFDADYVGVDNDNDDDVDDDIDVDSGDDMNFLLPSSI